MDRLLNFLRQWRLRAEITGLKAADSAKLHYERIINTVYLGALALLILSGPGIVLAWIGYECEATWLLGLGQFLIALGGMFATGMLCLFYLRVGVAGTHSLHALDGLLSFFSGGKIKNFFSKEVGANIRNELLNAFAWVAAFCTWCDIVPVWKYPVTIPIGATLAMFFAFASTRSWTFVEKPIGKAIVFAALAAVFLVNTVNAFTAGAVTDWAGTKGELAASYIRNDSAGSAGQREILDARQEFVRDAAKVRLWEYRRLSSRQLRIMVDPDRETPELKTEFAKNAARMRVLEGQNRPAKRAHRRAGGSAVSPSVSPSTETRITIPAANAPTGTGSWFSSNWGWLLIAALIVGLCVLACVGFATKRTWMSAPATLLLVALALVGSYVWLANRLDIDVATNRIVSGPASISLQVPIRPPQGAFQPMLGGAPDSSRRVSGTGLGRVLPVRAVEPELPPARGMREALDEIVPERPGDWR